MAKKNPQLRQRLKREHHLAHREEREQKERERFTQAPTGRQARHQAHAETNVEYAPVVRGIRQELANSAAQQKKGTEWYNQLGSQLAGAAQAEEGQATQLGSTLTQQLANANAQNAATLQQQEAANARFAQTTGMQGATGQAAAAGNAQSALTGISLNAPIQAAAQNQAALTRRLGLVQKEQGHEYALGKQGERKKIRQDLVAAQKQKGQAYVGRLGELRESARKQELDKKAFELEGQQTALQAQQEQEKLAQDERQSKRSAQTSRANSAASTAASVEGNQISRENAETARQKAQREQREFQAERRYKRNHHGMTPAEVAAAKKANQPSQSAKEDKRAELKEGWSAARQAIGALGKPPASFTEEDWRLLEKHLTDPRTGREPGAGIPFAVAAKVIAKMKERVGTAADPNGASLGR